MINLSIIIPIGRHENDFKLIKQIKQKFKGCEIILVVDEENKLINQKIEVDQLYLLRNSSRARALNKGINLSTRDIFGYCTWLRYKNINPSDLSSLNKFAVNTFLLKFNEANCRLIGAGANFRTKIFCIPFGDQSFLISKKLFNL